MTHSYTDVRFENTSPGIFRQNKRISRRITLDLEEKIISINHWALNIFELGSQDEAINKDFNGIIKDIQISELVEKKRNQISFNTPSGKKLILGLAASLLKDDNEKTIGYTVIFQDLTEIRA